MMSPLSSRMAMRMEDRRPTLTRTYLTRAWLLAGWTAALAGSAVAQTVCVVCSEPDAIYRCQADTNFARPGDTRLNLLCITEIAHAGQHGSCSVRRQQGGTCDGPLRTVAIVPPPAGSPPPPDAVTAPPGAPNAERSARSGPPDTVEELANRTAAQSKEQLDAATGAVPKTAVSGSRN